VLTAVPPLGLVLTRALPAPALVLRVPARLVLRVPVRLVPVLLMLVLRALPLHPPTPTFGNCLRPALRHSKSPRTAAPDIEPPQCAARSAEPRHRLPTRAPWAVPCCFQRDTVRNCGDSGHPAPSRGKRARLGAILRSQERKPRRNPSAAQLRARSRQSPASTRQTGVITLRSGLLREMPFMRMPNKK
jgi:hypothetical protein